MKVRTEIRELACALTEDEVNERALQVSKELQLLGEDEVAMKAQGDAWKQKIKTRQAVVFTLVRTVNEREEYRGVECETQNIYSLGVQRVVRLDTGEVVSSRALSQDEMAKGLQVRLPIDDADQGDVPTLTADVGRLRDYLSSVTTQAEEDEEVTA